VVPLGVRPPGVPLGVIPEGVLEPVAGVESAGVAPAPPGVSAKRVRRLLPLGVGVSVMVSQLMSQRDVVTVSHKRHLTLIWNAISSTYIN